MFCTPGCRSGLGPAACLMLSYEWRPATGLAAPRPRPGEPFPGRGPADQFDGLGRQPGQVRHRLVADVAVLAPGPAQQMGLVDPLLPVLPRVVATLGGHIDRAGTFTHQVIAA